MKTYDDVGLNGCLVAAAFTFLTNKPTTTAFNFSLTRVAICPVMLKKLQKTTAAAALTAIIQVNLC